MPDIFQSVVADNSTSIGAFFLCFSSSIILAFAISLIYKFTHDKESCAQSFVLSLVMLPGIVSIIILLINDTSKALGLAGAFSLVRFRSVPGDPKDIAYIFFSMAAGVGCGLGYIGFSVVFVLLLGVVMFVLKASKYASPDTSAMTLKITVPENLNYQGLFDDVLNQYTAGWRLKRVKTVDFGTLFDLVYSIELKNDVDQKKFIDALRTLNGNLNVTLILYKYDDKIYAN